MAISDTSPVNRPRLTQIFPPGPLWRNIKDFSDQDVKPETVYRLPEARVVFANYDLLQLDFPHLRTEQLEQRHPELSALSGAQKTAALQRRLDDWLKTNVAFISENQMKQTLVNTPIHVSDEMVTAYRPHRYGRALIFSLRENQRVLSSDQTDAEEDAPEGLLDVKGTGVGPTAEPGRQDHSNGLMLLGEAIREVAFHEIVMHVFRHADVPYWTVPVYGLLDLGFKAKLNSIPDSPAAMLVRRAHRRPRYRYNLKEPDSPEMSIGLEIELLLRRYGITSSSPTMSIELTRQQGKLCVKYGDTYLHYADEQLAQIEAYTEFTGERLFLEGLDIQFTREVNADPPRPQIVDFGGYWAKRKFENPILILVAGKLLRLGEIIRPDDPRFVQPDEQLCLPFEFWATPEEIQVSFDMANQYCEGKLTGADIRNQIDYYVQAAVSRWP